MMLSYMAKGTLQTWLKLRTLRWEIFLSFLGGLNLTTVSLKVEEKVKNKKVCKRDEKN